MCEGEGEFSYVYVFVIILLLILVICALVWYCLFKKSHQHKRIRTRGHRQYVGNGMELTKENDNDDIDAWEQDYEDGGIQIEIPSNSKTDTINRTKPETIRIKDNVQDKFEDLKGAFLRNPAKTGMLLWAAGSMVSTLKYNEAKLEKEVDKLINIMKERQIVSLETKEGIERLDTIIRALENESRESDDNIMRVIISNLQIYAVEHFKAKKVRVDHYNPGVNQTVDDFNPLQSKQQIREEMYESQDERKNRINNTIKDFDPYQVQEFVQPSDIEMPNQEEIIDFLVHRQQFIPYDIGVSSD